MIFYEESFLAIAKPHSNALKGNSKKTDSSDHLVKLRRTVTNWKYGSGGPDLGVMDHHPGKNLSLCLIIFAATKNFRPLSMLSLSFRFLIRCVLEIVSLPGGYLSLTVSSSLVVPSTIRRSIQCCSD